LAPLISLADICVAPGEVGLTAMHSLVYGTPVITHNNYLFQMPEYEAIIEGKTGSLYEYGSNDSLIEKIKQWLENGTDREVIRENCYKIIYDYYNPKKQVEFINNAVMDKFS
jgi:glycosyltransferase involved in cell wall biosynthesis